MINIPIPKIDDKSLHPFFVELLRRAPDSTVFPFFIDKNTGAIGIGTTSPQWPYTFDATGPTRLRNNTLADSIVVLQMLTARNIDCNGSGNFGVLAVTTKANLNSLDTFGTTNLNGPVTIGHGGASLSTITTGSYTPTLTNGTNVSASGANATNYYRIGNLVTVFGTVSIDVAAAAASVLSISLPIASNFTNIFDLGGTANNTVADSAPIYADTTNDIAILNWTPATTTNVDYAFTFSYVVK